MRQVAQRFKADELEIVRDFMRQAKEVFQHQVRDAVHDVHGAVHGALHAEDDPAQRDESRGEGSPEGK